MDLVPPDTWLVGRWTRSLLVRYDGTRDAAATVTWLQASGLYVDLRLPVQAPSLSSSSLGDLDRHGLTELAATEGFAGRLVADGGWARWHRLVDLQPPASTPDEASLEAEQGAPDTVVETGRDGTYVEHWQREARPAAPVAGVILRERATGALAVLVRVGSDVGWARGRAVSLPRGVSLVDLVASAGTDAAARALLDTEVALGRVDPGGAVLERSSLPWRTGAWLHVAISGDEATTAEQDDTDVRRTWRVVGREGSVADLPLSPTLGGKPRP